MSHGRGGAGPAPPRHCRHHTVLIGAETPGELGSAISADIHPDTHAGSRAPPLPSRALLGAGPPSPVARVRHFIDDVAT
jgi:hypothetical protein